jgi:uncharacterized protein (DUF1697 family)
MRYVALLRGINVGKNKRIAMADLRKLFEKLGYTEVRTLLNSGNVVFRVTGARKNLGPTIEQAIAERLGVSCRVMIVSAEEMAAIVAETSLLKVATDPSRFLLGVLSSLGDVEKIRELEQRSWGAERLAIRGRVAYMWCPDGIIESAVGGAVGKALKDAVTVRNWATMTRLDAMLKAGEST